MKTCRICGKTKPFTEFYRMAGMRDGHRNECKRCNLDAKAARHRANPAEAIERVRRWRADNPERYAEAQRRTNARRKTPEGKRRERAGYLKRTYGITVEEYDRLLAGQDGACAICGRPPRSDIALHVDHEHGSGRVRGLLCFRCNNALGDFDDDRGRLSAALHYLGPVPQDEATRARVAGLVALAGARRPA